jgi:hypothetical protein
MTSPIAGFPWPFCAEPLAKNAEQKFLLVVYSPTKEAIMGRGILLWLIGVPIPVIILWHWSSTIKKVAIVQKPRRRGFCLFQFVGNGSFHDVVCSAMTKESSINSPKLAVQHRQRIHELMGKIHRQRALIDQLESGQRDARPARQVLGEMLAALDASLVEYQRLSGMTQKSGSAEHVHVDHSRVPPSRKTLLSR